MARKTTAVSIEADRTYVGELNSLARDLGTNTGALIRSLVDEKYGDEIARRMADSAKRAHRVRQLSSFIEGS